MRRRVVLVLTVALIGGGAVTWWFLRDRDPQNRRSAAWLFLFNCPEAAKLVGAPSSDEDARAVLPRVSCRREQHGVACTGAVRAKDGAQGTLRLSFAALGETRGVTLELGGRSIDLGTCNAREQMRQCGSGKAVACFELASWHARGSVVARDLKIARLLAETGCLIDVDACRTLLPPELEGSDRGYRAALDRLARSSALCRGGEARACRTVAEQLEQGRGVARDPAAAARFLEQARRLEGSRRGAGTQVR